MNLRIKNWKTFAKLSMHDHAKSKWTEAHILAKQQLVLLSSNNTASQPKEIKSCFLLLSIRHFSNENVIMFNNSKRKPRNRRKNKVRQDWTASILFMCSPCVREIQFLEVLLNFLTSMPGTESQDTVFDESNISQIAMSHAVLLKSHLGSLQWDRKGFERKVQVNQTHFPTGSLSKA